MTTIDLISGFEAIMPILRAIADSQQLSFGEAWRLVTFYKRYRNIDAFIDYVEEVPVENYPELLADAISLDKETSEILHIYNVSKAQLTSFDPKTVYKEHLEPMKSEYQSAQEKSAFRTRTRCRIPGKSTFRACMCSPVLWIFTHTAIRDPIFLMAYRKGCERWGGIWLRTGLLLFYRHP